MNNFILLTLVCSSAAFGMEPKNKQLEVCPGRRAYIQQVAQQKKDAAEKNTVPVCPFCDPVIMASNYVLAEQKAKNRRIMMNKNPYFRQGRHLMGMPISHIESFQNFSREELEFQADAMRRLSKKLHNHSYSQENFINDGPLGGQSVKHVHWHCKNFEKSPCSVKESLHSPVMSAEEVFHATKQLLPGIEEDSSESSEQEEQQYNADCLCCSFYKNADQDEENLVIFRGKYNIICLSPYPSSVVELTVAPIRHVSSIKDLSREEYRENMMFAVALLPILKKYAQDYVRECGGGNVYTKNIGGLATRDEQERYHVHTLVMPRTTIALTPGTLDGNSCKLDMDPVHLFQYLKEKNDEFSVLTQ